MNQQRLAAAVLDQLREAAAADPLAWVRVIAGLAEAQFGERPTRAQLDVLARLTTAGEIEFRAFKPNRKTGALGPPHGDDQTVYMLSSAAGSQPLQAGRDRQYGVRLRAGP